MNNTKLTDVRNHLQDVLNVLDSVIANNETLTSAAPKLDMTPQRLSRELNDSFKYFLKNHIDTLSKSDIEKLFLHIETPGVRLIKTILGIPSNKLIDIPYFDEYKFWDTVYTYVSPREYDILCARYGHTSENGHMITLRDTGEQFGVKQERIRQIERKAVFKLRRASILCSVFDIDIRSEINTIQESQKKLMTEYYEVMNMYRQCVNLINSKSEMYELCDYIHEHYPNLEPIVKEEYSCDIPIEELNLSVRPYNCLKRSGRSTVEDIYKTSAEDMLHIRNLGKNSLKEVIHAMKSINMYNPDWDSLNI